MNTNLPHTTPCQALIAGAGPAGLAAAILLAKEGVSPTLLARSQDISVDALSADPRTVALMQPAIRLLNHIGVWNDDLRSHSTPLNRLALIDDTGQTFAAADLVFNASELGPEPFGWNIPLAKLLPALFAELTARKITIIEAEAQHFAAHPDHAAVKTDVNEISAKVVIAADGRQSILRKTAGIPTRDHHYDQVAIVTSFSHSAAHFETSTEVHKPNGLITTVPLPGNRSSLVWMVTPEQGEEILALTDEQFCRQLQIEIKGELGRVETAAKRVKFPMVQMAAQRMAKNRLLLVGEAAHVMTPIGAQGLNLSLRDVAYAAELIVAAADWDEDPGSDIVVRKYHHSRGRDVTMRQLLLHGMNRSLLAKSPVAHAIRAAGLTLAGSINPLRQAAMKKGIADDNQLLPRFMRA